MATSEPYRINPLPFSLSGWFTNQSILSYLITLHNVHTVIEVGCWVGWSTLFFASQVQKVYAVDHWEGSSEHRGHPQLPTLYHQFLSNIIHAGYTETVVPIRAPSLEAAKRPLTADLIYIDASHKEEDVLADLSAWHSHLNPQGIFCGDDWKWPSVRSAVEQYASTHNLTIDTLDNFWRLQEI